MTLNARLAIALLACCTSAQAQGQTVWRCGPDGRVFSDTPCAEGRLVATVDPRPAADVHAARDMARREQRLADRLREERLQREAVGPGAGPGGHRPRQRADQAAGGEDTEQAPSAAEAPCRRRYLARNCSGVSKKAGLTGMQFTGQS
jgi:hypothetical protein